MTDINDIWRFDLRKGNSADPRDGACLMDAVSWLEYGTLGDHPPCVCPVIAAFARGVNDAMNDEDRQRLKVYLPRLVGTVDPNSEQARAEYLAWQAIRVFAPLALDTAGLHAEATNLRDFKGSLAEAAKAAEAAAWAAAKAATEAAEAAAWAAAKAARTAYAAARAAKAAAEAAGAAEAAYAAARAAYAGARAAYAAARAAYAGARAAYAAARAAYAGARAAEAGAWAADAAARAAEAAEAEAAIALISALDGVLKIGRQAEPVLPARLVEANERFELARV